MDVAGLDDIAEDEGVELGDAAVVEEDVELDNTADREREDVVLNDGLKEDTRIIWDDDFCCGTRVDKLDIVEFGDDSDEANVESDETGVTVTVLLIIVTTVVVETVIETYSVTAVIGDEVNKDGQELAGDCVWELESSPYILLASRDKIKSFQFIVILAEVSTRKEWDGRNSIL